MACPLHRTEPRSSAGPRVCGFAVTVAARTGTRGLITAPEFGTTSTGEGDEPQITAGDVGERTHRLPCQR